MTVSRDAIAALLLLAVFTAYGLLATQIDLFPGQETEPFKPRTMPYALAITGVALALLRLLQTMRIPASQRDWRGFDWSRAGLLCLCMLGYGAAFVPLGFMPSTILFLTAGFLVLGERRRSVLIILPASFTIVFWLLITRVLGLYLAPGVLVPV